MCLSPIIAKILTGRQANALLATWDITWKRVAAGYKMQVWSSQLTQAARSGIGKNKCAHSVVTDGSF